ncbi:MAG: hypothetical protein ACE5GN_03105, partial [Waddliaceae bacterium]
MFQDSVRRYCLCFFPCAITLAMITGCSSNSSDETTGNLSEEDIQMLSETMGHIIVENLNSQDVQINFESLIKGIENAQEGGSPPLSKKQYFHLLVT